MIRRAVGERGWTIGASASPLPVVLWPAAAYLLSLYLFPLGRLLVLSVVDPQSNLTFEHYRRLWEVPLYSHVLANTFEIALTVAVVTLVLGYPTAYLLATASDRVRGILLAFVLIPFFTSLLVRNYAWIFLLGSRGVINTTLRAAGLTDAPLELMFNRFGVLVGMVHILLPYVTLVLLAVMRGINPQLLTAAYSLASGPFTAFRRVFFPLSLPGVGGGFLLVFVLALAFFVTPAMLGGAGDVMIANVIASQMGLLNWNFAAALATTLLVASLFVIGLMQWLFGGGSLLDPGLGRLGRRPGLRLPELGVSWALDRVLNPVWPYVPPVVGGVTLAFLVLPILVMIPLSFNAAPYFVFPPPGYSLQWYRAFLASPDWLAATWNSVQIGLGTTLLTMALAVPAALGIARSRSRLVTVVYALVLSPMIVPGIIIAIAVFFLLSDLGLTGTRLGVVLGHTIGSLPISIVVLVSALRNFDTNLEKASLSLGAGPIRTVVRVTMPVLKGAMLTAAFFAFLHSFDELLVALFVSGIDAGTLPKKMWESLQEINPTITAVSTLLILFTVVGLAVLQIVQRTGALRRSASFGGR